MEKIVIFQGKSYPVKRETDKYYILEKMQFRKNNPAIMVKEKAIKPAKTEKSTEEEQD